MYYPLRIERIINREKIYPNNYEYSDIREWLNINFYNKAFTKQQQAYINESMINNSLSSTGDKTNRYICNSSIDKIYLPSYSEMTNISYGYNNDLTRQKQLTDYAKALGCDMNIYSSYYNNGYYWLRSPDGSSSFYARIVSIDGYLNNFNIVYGTDVGIAPALTITIK